MKGTAGPAGTGRYGYPNLPRGSWKFPTHDGNSVTRERKDTTTGSSAGAIFESFSLKPQKRFVLHPPNGNTQKTRRKPRVNTKDT